MFKKLLSNLAFNPSLINQVSFYASRLRDEEKLRKLGLGFVALAFFVQIFATAFPPEPSLAASANDIVYGGVRDQNHMAQIFESGRDSAGRADIQQIFRHFGITSSAQIRNGRIVSIPGNQPGKYYTYGRSVSSRGYLQTINAGGTTIYQRDLSIWDPISWRAIELTNSRGQRMYILTSCGNPVTTPTPHVTPPKLELTKQSNPTNNQIVKRGDQITYSLLYRNTAQTIANEFHLKDSLPNQVDFVRYNNEGPGLIRSGRDLTFHHFSSIARSDFGHTTTWHKVSVVVRVRSDASGNFCNRATAHAKNASTVTSNQVCHTVEIPSIRVCDLNTFEIITIKESDFNGSSHSRDLADCEREKCPYDERLNADDPNCGDAKCELLSATMLTRNSVRFELQASASHNAVVNDFRLNLGDGNTETLKAGGETDGLYTGSLEYTYPEDARTYTAALTARTSVGDKSGGDCTVEITVEEPLEPVIVVSKGVSNDTQNIVDANGTKARPGDTLIFTITAENVGEGPEDAYTFPRDNVMSILEYADITDQGDAELIEEDGISYLVWSGPVAIGTGDKVSKSFSIKVKEKLPQTNTPESDRESYDCTITNSIAGEGISAEAVVVSFDFHLCKPVEQITSHPVTLPNTGPGTGLAAVFAITTGASYFTARARLMRKELSVIKSSFSATHGGK